MEPPPEPSGGVFPFMDIGSIQVLASLGQGAKSNVMLVRREADGLQYALKVTNVARRNERKYLTQARQEFKVLQQLDHPNIVRAFAIETETDWLVRPTRVKILLEHIPGCTIDRLSSPGVGTLLRVFEQAADAVAHLHETGLLHADLKPNNIMLGPNAAKLIDFGLAREIGEDTDRLQGTPEYMAPETAARKTVDVRTDIYSFGATMYRMFTGQYPPMSAGGFPMTERYWSEQYRHAADVNHALPEVVAELIDRCLCFNPSDRPPSMDEVCRELNRIVDSLTTA